MGSLNLQLRNFPLPCEQEVAHDNGWVTLRFAHTIIQATEIPYFADYMSFFYMI